MVKKELLGAQTRLDKVRLDCIVCNKFTINYHFMVVVVVIALILFG